MGLEGAVSFIGQLPEAEKNEQMRRAHFLIHTSIREGWGLNVIEANAMGTPAVVYPVEGLVDSTVHEESGLIAPEETPTSAAECLMTVVASPANYQTYRRAAWERAKTFHWEWVLPRGCDWLEDQARKPNTRRT